MSGIGELQELRAALSRGTHDLQGLRDLRTSFGDKLDVNNRTARSAAKQLWGELSEDIFGGLKAAGKRDAARAYRAADKAYAQSKADLDAIQKVLGDGSSSSDAIAQRLARMGKGDALRLHQALAGIPPEMQGELRAAVVHNLGRRRAGQATGDDEFSISTFATGWNSLDEQARYALVPATGHRVDLDAIATLANADRRLHKTGDNPSGSARMLNNIGEVGFAATSVTSALMGGPIGIGTLVGTFGARWLPGAILASPLLAKAMVKVGNSGVTEGTMKMLTRAARATPAYAGEIIGLRNKLQSIKTENVASGAELEASEFDQFDEAAPEPNYFDQFDE